MIPWQPGCSLPPKNSVLSIVFDCISNMVFPKYQRCLFNPSPLSIGIQSSPRNMVHVHRLLDGTFAVSLPNRKLCLRRNNWIYFRIDTNQWSLDLLFRIDTSLPNPIGLPLHKRTSQLRFTENIYFVPHKFMMIVYRRVMHSQQIEMSRKSNRLLRAMK